MRVELLYWDGDPNYMTARQRLVEVLTEDAFETPIQMIAINSATGPARACSSEGDRGSSASRATHRTSE